jgi:hypothetical protein
MPEHPEQYATTTPDADEVDPVVEYGATGLPQSGGTITEEWLPQLTGQRAHRAYREMRDNDSTIGALLFAIESAIRQVEWETRPVDQTPEARADAEFVDSCLEDMSHTWSDFLAEALSMLVFGWSYHEIVYKVRDGDNPDDPTHDSRFDDGRIGWRKMPIRAQETLEKWELDEHGGIHGLWQVLPNGNRRYVPIEKSLLFRTSQHKGNPEGRSMLRNAYRSWYFLKRIQDIEAIGIERDLAGLPIIGVPPALFAASGSDALEEWKRIGRNIRVDDQTCIVYPLAYDESGNPAIKIELLSTNGSRLFDTSQIIDRYTRSMLMAVLADVILLGHESTGTQALAIEKSQYFLRGLQSMLDSIAQTFNTYAIPRLFALNGIRRVAYPTLQPGSLERTDAALLTSAIAELSKAGMPIFPDPATEAYIRTILGLPEQTDWLDGELPTDERSANNEENLVIETPTTGSTTSGEASQ